MQPQPNFPPFLVLGKVTLVTPGTLVGLLDVYNSGNSKSAVSGEKVRTVSILFVVAGVITVNTGNIYIGVKGMNKATGAGVIFIIPAAAVGVTNWFTLPAQGFGGSAEICPEDIFIDGDTAGNSVIVTCTTY